jgi:hypothetical protein
MPTNKPQTRTFVMPDMADRFPSSTPPGLPPDGYVIVFSATDGYYVAGPSTRLQIISSPGTSPYNAGSIIEDVINVQTHAGTFIVNLPTNPLVGTNYFIKDFAGVAALNPINITTTQLVDGSNPYQIANNYGAIHVVFNGTTWSVISKF